MNTCLRRPALRMMLAGLLAFSGLSAATRAEAAAPPEKSFPDSAAFFIKAGNMAGLREAFRQSQYGQLLADPAFKPFKDDVLAKLDERGSDVKAAIGVDIKELIDIPQGPIALAVIPRDGDAERPAATILTVDAGKNEAKLLDILNKATKHGEESGTKVSKEEFNGLTLSVITIPKSKDAKEGDRTPPPLTWAKKGSLFYVGTDTEAVKDLIGKSASGREDSVANSPKYAQAIKKLGEENQVFWFSDFGNLFKIIKKAGAQGKNAANIDQMEAMIPVFGINGLKAAAGSYNMNSGSFDSVTKTFVMIPAPLRGLLKVIALPKVSLTPEPWVPATVASYQTFSWDLDKAFAALNDLANTFQPGVMNILEQQLVGANGGEPLNFKKDIFDPIGDRFSIVTDYKKPINENSQRVLFSVALEDPKTFEGTLQKLISLGGAPPRKRDFNGTTIYEFESPELPNAPNGANVQLQGPISVALAKQSLMLATDPGLLESILRGGSPSLAESTSFTSIQKDIPETVSSLTYVRPDESARVSYKTLKDGQFDRALQGANVAGGPDLSKVKSMYDKDKLPDFSVFAKYLSEGGGFSIVDEDGISITNFTLRKGNP